MQTLHCALGGRLNERHTAQVAEVCAQHAGALAYSVHSPAVLDLRDRADPDLHHQILLSCVKFSAAIGARVLIVHYEERSEEAAVEARFRAAIEEAAELAGAHELILGIENIEVERTERVLEFLEAVRHPWVRMTYDFAHDYLASGHFGYDHLASARACVPYAAHLHLTDNFGRFNPARLGDFNLYRAIPPANTYITGLGDLHLPLGWGTLPAAAIFAGFAAAGYRGLLISEHDRRSFPAEDAAVRASMQALVAGA
jgi:sugar phosphate isomerase/epimerase